MLSIGKLGIGHCSYYERSVADGAEDYYSGKGEEQGSYVGRGAEQLGLDGVLAHGDLNDVMRGRHPSGGRWHERQLQAKVKPRQLRLKNGDVIEKAPPQATAAFDLTFSAPKSVSVLWGMSDGPVAADVKAAHAEAVRQAVDYMERTACMTRRGKGGRQHLRGEGFVGAAFTHRSSRAGDPQLHTHVIVANATRATSRIAGIPVSKYSALHGALLYREAKTCGYLYQAVLREELSRRLGVEWTQVQNGQAEIVGVDRELCDTFSKRADEIAEQLAIVGHASAKAANAAAIDTRAAKDYSVHGAHLKERWIEEAAQIDAPDPLHALGRINDQDRPAVPDDRELNRLAQDLFAKDGLTRNASTFARRDVIRAVAEATTAGASVEQIEQAADRIIDLSTDQILMLAGADDPLPDSPTRRADGTVLADYRCDRPFTTRELLAAEHTVLANMVERADEGAAMVPAKQVQRLLDARPDHLQLAADQRSMVESLTTSGAGMQVVVGLGGAGKTFSVEAAHDAWQAEGIVVRGTALADAAARNLQDETGVPSRTIATLRLWAEPGTDSGFSAQPEKAFPSGGVLIVDEAGMVSTRDLAFLTEGCRKHGTKLVLIGDHMQLPEIEAGGTFRGLVHRFEPENRVERLVNNRRQHHTWERAALAQLRAGNAGDAIAAYADQERIVASAKPDELRQQMVTDWLDARAKHPEVAMIAYTNHDVTALNDHARTLLDQRGDLGTERRTFAGREWAVGDQLLCLQNNHRLDLSNGTRGEVTDVTRNGLRIQTASGQDMEIPRDYLERGGATYGYAATGHKTQGKTINGEAFVLASDYISREWMYVALSRAKDASRIYIDTIDHDPTTGRTLTPKEQSHAAIIELCDLASRSRSQTMATDHQHDTSRLSNRELQRLADRDLPPAERTIADAERTRREGALRDRLISDPPRYLLPAIGPVPMDARKRDAWARDAARLETHRQQNGLTPAQMTTEIATRVLGRGRGRGRGLGHEL